MFHGQESSSQLWQALLIAMSVWCWSEFAWFADSESHFPVKHKDFEELLHWSDWEIQMKMQIILSISRWMH